jgi:epoxyqueuosine reductase QueG
MDIIKMAIDFGAVAVGVVNVESLLEAGAMDHNILRSAKTILIIACGHSRAALNSKNLQMKQNDTIATYEMVRAVCKKLAMALEEKGFEALAIPAYLPIDMSDEKYGMVGPVDLRKVAVEAGVGNYGKSGLVLVDGFGPRVRLGAVLTSADLKPTKKETRSPCPSDCQICLISCPSKVLLGQGKIDKRACGQVLFKFGLRGMTKFMGEMFDASPGKRASMLKSYPFRELWQTLVTGNYYYCFECQASCPVGKFGS